jgi:hypothetical protein
MRDSLKKKKKKNKNIKSKNNTRAEEEDRYPIFCWDFERHKNNVNHNLLCILFNYTNITVT